MEPKWNVKVSTANSGPGTRTRINGTKVECKG